MEPDIKSRIDDLRARAVALKGRWEAGELDAAAFAIEQAELASEYEAIGRDHRASAPEPAPRAAPIVGERLVTAVRAFCDAYLSHDRR